MLVYAWDQARAQHWLVPPAKRVNEGATDVGALFYLGGFLPEHQRASAQRVGLEVE